MSIPKVIHYCWFGGNPLPPLAKKCIASWKKFCPDYEIICHDESLFDVSQNRYAREAYDAKKWAFVSDYARLKILYDHGGIYLDTDVELLKPLDDLLEEGFLGFDDNGVIATGLGFACEAGNPLIGALLADYEEIPFLLPDGKFDLTPCPDRNAKVLRAMGLDTSVQSQVFCGIRLYPEEYFCPMKYVSGKLRVTENTYSIHYFSASWISPAAKRTLALKRILGEKFYHKLYGKFFQNCDFLEW